MKAICGTDIGLTREENQDRVAIEYFDNAILGVVCDGMGGATHGSEASSIAIKAFIDNFKSGYKTDLSDNDIKYLLVQSMEYANDLVYYTSLSDIDKFGMGTTCVAVLVTDEGHFYTVNVGDSRAYLIADEEYVQITIDHNYAQYLYQIGEIDKDEIETHPNRHMLMRAIGVEDAVQTDFFDFSLEIPFKILICSDGLHGYVQIDDIMDIINNSTLDEIPSKLICKANACGGKDNVSMVVIERDLL
ncbi:MAG: protein phosphatase 2C domain-containing protein [Oscillospiraceae bacterium]